MKGKGWDMLGRRVRESLQQFIQTSLLKTFDIIFHFFVYRKLIRIELQLVT